MPVGLRLRAVWYAAHVVAVALAAMVLVWCIYYMHGLAWNSSDKSLLFNIHPVLTLIGFVILGGEAIMIYKALSVKKEAKKVIHMVLNGVALVVGIVGVAAVIKFHNEKGIENFYSVHSWLGIGVLALYAIQWFYSFLVFFYPGGTQQLRRISLKWHVFLGLFIFILAIGSAVTGFLEKLTFLEKKKVAKFSSEAYLVNFTAIGTVLYGVLVVMMVYSEPEVEQPEAPELGYTAI